MMTEGNGNQIKSTDPFEGEIHYKSFRLTLTPREKEILELVAQGYLNKQIAYILHLDEQTIKNHLVNSYKKLGVTNRTQAAVKLALHNI